MKFLVEHSIPTEQSNRDFYLAKDKSLMYTKSTGDYSVYLGGNWRFELIVDSATGVCQKFQSFLGKLNPKNKPLILPQAKKSSLIFVSDELTPFDGCRYSPFDDKAFWDYENRILCIGNPDASGDAVEFTPKTIAVIRNERLECMYLLLDSIAEDLSF